jgi:hypothetical protein
MFRTVGLIFPRYLKLKTVRRVREEPGRRLIVSRQWVSKGEVRHGGLSFHQPCERGRSGAHFEGLVGGGTLGATSPIILPLARHNDLSGVARDPRGAVACG